MSPEPPANFNIERDIPAKREGTTLTGVEVQAEKYAISQAVQGDEPHNSGLSRFGPHPFIGGFPTLASFLSSSSRFFSSSAGWTK
jgi:hypothetical protein